MQQILKTMQKTPLLFLILLTTHVAIYSQTESLTATTGTHLGSVVEHNQTAESATDLKHAIDMLTIAFCGDDFKIKADATQRQTITELNNRLTVLSQNAGINIYLLYAPPVDKTGNGQQFTDNLHTANSGIDLLINVESVLSAESKQITACNMYIAANDKITDDETTEIRDYIAANITGITFDNRTAKSEELVTMLENMFAAGATVTLESIKFSTEVADNYIQLQTDDTPPHYHITGSTINSRPVCIVRNSKLKAIPVFIVSGKVTEPRIKATYTLNSEEKTEEVTAEYDAVTQKLTVTEIEPLFISSPSTVDYLPAFEIKWEVSTNSGRKWIDAEISTNDIYVTLAQPYVPLENIITELIHFGCLTAKDTDNKTDLLSAIWERFKINTPGIMQSEFGMTEGSQLKYYSNPNIDHSVATKLLQDADGQCGAWTDLLFNVLFYQGFELYPELGFEQFSPKYHSTETNLEYKELMLVKNWDIPSDKERSNQFIHPITQEQLDYCNLRYSLTKKIVRKTDSTGTLQWVEENRNVLVERKPGIEGQGTPNPISNFDMHSMLKIMLNGEAKYYDPSYGVTFDTINDIENNIDGFYHVDEDNEVRMKDKNNNEVIAYPVYFRKNESRNNLKF